VTITGPVAVSATFASAAGAPQGLDIDGNGEYDALTDGLLILRGLFGLTGAGLTAGAVGAGATLSDPAAIAARLADLLPLLDIDGDGRADALTDGLLAARYLFGLRGQSLIQGALAAGATRTAAADIEAYLATLLP
jgi:hypothetical protein